MSKIMLSRYKKFDIKKVFETLFNDLRERSQMTSSYKGGLENMTGGGASLS